MGTLGFCIVLAYRKPVSNSCPTRVILTGRWWKKQWTVYTHVYTRVLCWFVKNTLSVYSPPVSRRRRLSNRISHWHSAHTWHCTRCDVTIHPRSILQIMEPKSIDSMGWITWEARRFWLPCKYVLNSNPIHSISFGDSISRITCWNCTRRIAILSPAQSTNPSAIASKCTGNELTILIYLVT